MRKNYVLLAVIAGGAAVLALELIGTRILGPYYGASIFLWSSLITVTLAALSAGYVAGGMMADRHPSFVQLSGLLLCAGIWIALIPILKYPCLRVLEPIGLRASVLLASVILFFLPLACLGAISPIAIKLRAQQMNEVGRVAGNLYALSTIGGVCSALLTGFYLIPEFGTQILTFSLGALLAIVSFVGYVTIGKKGLLILAFGSVFLALAGAALVHAQGTPHPGLRDLEESPYAELRVFDSDLGRHLLIDGGIHSLVDTSTWTSTLPYTAVMEIPMMFFPRPGRALLIGLGGGSLAKEYFREKWTVDAVELDPHVARIATSYFDLNPQECSVQIMDGRRYLEQFSNIYDIILLDAFGSSSIPFHLVTLEAFHLIASHLKPGGILAMNVETRGWNDPVVAHLTATLQKVFRSVTVLPIAEPPDSFGNVVLLARQDALTPLREFGRNYELQPDWRFSQDYQKTHAWDNRFTPATDGVFIYTDDRNSIDLSAEAINFSARQHLHNYFEQIKGASW